ncbi:hypothetical protein AGMMS49574_17570 [Bacteroidia bacterium]|nr:hypothetical protein AGMMS49574_17570 [Bacteroidia bacterium]
MCIGLKMNKNLIGNTVVYLAERCKPLYHTKLLKLLYLIDEEATNRTGAPITWLNYNVWQFGPVTEDVYFSKIEGLNKLSDFVRFENVRDNSFIIKPIKQFSNAELSDLDMQIINDVVVKYGNMTTKQLIDLTHAEGSLWYKTKKRAGLQFSNTNRTSNISLNFADLVENDGFKKTIYYATLENVELQSTLNDF